MEYAPGLKSELAITVEVRCLLEYSESGAVYFSIGIVASVTYMKCELMVIIVKREQSKV